MSTVCRLYGSGPYIKFPIDSDSRFRRNNIASSDIFLVNQNGIPNSAGIPTGICNLGDDCTPEDHGRYPQIRDQFHQKRPHSHQGSADRIYN